MYRVCASFYLVERYCPLAYLRIRFIVSSDLVPKFEQTRGHKYNGSKGYF